MADKKIEDLMLEKAAGRMDLLTDDDWRDILKTAMSKLLVDPVETYENYRNVTRPPRFIQHINDKLEAELKKRVSEHVESRKADIDKAIGDFLDKNAIAIYAAHQLSVIFSNLTNEIYEKFRR